MRATFSGVIDGLIDAGLTDADDSDLTARTFLHILNGHISDSAFDSSANADERAEHIWRFCARALQISPEPPNR